VLASPEGTFPTRNGGNEQPECAPLLTVKIISIPSGAHLD
jgi:hypothetical protein